MIYNIFSANDLPEDVFSSINANWTVIMISAVVSLVIIFSCFIIKKRINKQQKCNENNC